MVDRVFNTPLLVYVCKILPMVQQFYNKPNFSNLSVQFPSRASILIFKFAQTLCMVRKFNSSTEDFPS